MLTGTATNDTLTGSSQNDTLNGGLGSDTLNGGGYDTAVYLGNRAIYTIIHSGGVTTRSVPDGADTLTSIEKLGLQTAYRRRRCRLISNADGTSDLLWRHRRGVRGLG